ncbi:unnamed protein product [Arabidopsis lyrata]|uniref:RING-type domain-containing protein n=1 Tax=Arabidopsis lyrata subsp. lyrata TaxID=81972 RepID=D7LI81_ARALL|nr:RING-H2 finger protein ATL20 [Arabidopsis lyrata subsp. lyrata]EFH55019.1 hypothetical protein ARALYDRAFT_900985 [Arabidopsis lyrata subsp. lyrata]CAH8263373.1 unnamed protein product [Arabidopsis lyrata]|eukprot:XP_002878760.1 RING-H2 finger protein ATL20 [Arabidopsis lyrata subsp. lyrata]
MDTESFKLDVHVKAWSQAPSSGFLSTVVISLNREFEEFLINENDDSVMSLGSYPDSSLHDPLISLKLPSFKPNYVYQLLQTQLHDHVLSEQISYKVVEAQRQRSQSFYLPQQQPLFMIVSVKLTQKVYNVVPCSSASLATDLDQESQEEEESKTCAICLENLSRSEDYCQMPYCSHCFHERCVTKWVVGHNNSCPLCRKPVDK